MPTDISFVVNVTAHVFPFTLDTHDTTLPIAASTAHDVTRFVLHCVTAESTGIVATQFDTMLVEFIFTSSTGNS